MIKRLLDNLANAIEDNAPDSVFKPLFSNRHFDANARLPRENNPPALVFAAEYEREHVVERLLNAGARVDELDDTGQSASHAAAEAGHLGMICLLLPHKPDLTLKSRDGKTVLRCALRDESVSRRKFTENEDEDVALLLIRAGASWDDLDRGDLCRLAATSVPGIQLLMNRNVVVSDLRDEFGETPLHIAMRYAAPVDLLRKLVDCGVDLEAHTSDISRATCINFASSKADALRLFLMAGANIEGAGAEPLLCKSIIPDNLECSMLLLAAGADVTVRDRRGRTALLLASRLYSDEVMSLVHALLAAGADLDAADKTGETPRLSLAERQLIIDPEQIETARGEIAKLRLDFVRNRAMEVCIGLQSLRLDSVQLCEILQHACGPLARVIAFHQWWKIATTVKHFKK
jgi:ankyrin repeat protein